MASPLLCTLGGVETISVSLCRADLVGGGRGVGGGEILITHRSLILLLLGWAKLFLPSLVCKGPHPS